MKLISNKEFGGERPLFASHGLRLENVTIHVGESALKECSDITAERCRFEGKYPFWHVDGFRVERCEFTPGARAALWYSRNLVMLDTKVDAPKMFREMSGLRLQNVQLADAQETLWYCRDISLQDVSADHADYILKNCENIRISNFRLNGNYSFQYSRNVEIHDSVMNTKDAFWETDNVTVYDSVLNGEYLGWHSRNLTLINCTISGTQPLCYAENLTLKNCSFTPDADLAFEYSSVNAELNSPVTSVKNPLTGRIRMKSVGQIILDENIKQPADCIIETEEQCDGKL